MRIFVDATGGDLAPQAPVEGTVEALRRNPELTVTLAGIVPEIEKYLAGADDVRSRITLLDAPEVITNHESPVMGVRKKTKSATVLGMLAVRDKEADGFVSAGSTGAVLAGGMFRLGRIPGEPALKEKHLAGERRGPVGRVVRTGTHQEIVPHALPHQLFVEVQIHLIEEILITAVEDERRPGAKRPDGSPYARSSVPDCLSVRPTVSSSPTSRGKAGCPRLPRSIPQPRNGLCGAALPTARRDRPYSSP